MILFANRWGSNRINSWSGTPNGILEALNNKLGTDKVKELNLGNNKIINIFENLGKGLLKLLRIDGCDICAVILDSIDLGEKTKKYKNQPIIVFKELVGKNVEKSYLFIDCSVDYAFRCHESGIFFEKYVPFAKKRKYSMLSKRNELAKGYYENCQGIFTMGKWLRKELIENCGLPENKVHAVGGGCNICVNKINTTAKRGNKFLFVGKDFERKGGVLVLNAFKYLNSIHKGEYELYIAGPEEWPLNSPVPENVRFLGMKTQEEISNYYNICDVFVMPSYFEAYGMVFLEALIYGLPCIGRNCCEMPEFINPEENGDLIEQDNYIELAEKMFKVIKNKEMIQRVDCKRKEYIVKYSWEAVADRICKIVEDDGYKI